MELTIPYHRKRGSVDIIGLLKFQTMHKFVGSGPGIKNVPVSPDPATLLRK